MEKPLVTIVIPNYNHAAYLSERLETVFNQTFTDYEVILLDDCSSDDSLAQLKGYMNHIKVKGLIENKKNSGSPFKQWMKGLSHAEGRYLWIAESDDVAHPDFLKFTVGAMQRQPNAAFAFVDSELIDENGKKIGLANCLSKKKGYTLTFQQVESVQAVDFYGADYVVDYLFTQSRPANASSVLFDCLFLRSALHYAVSYRYTGDRMVYACSARGNYRVISLQVVANRARVSSKLKHGATFLDYYEEAFNSINTLLRDKSFLLTDIQRARLSSTKIELSPIYFVRNFVRVIRIFRRNIPLAIRSFSRSLSSAINYRLRLNSSKKTE